MRFDEITETEQIMNTQHNNEHQQAKEKLTQLFDDVLTHDGFGEIRVEVKILKRKQKEIILHCGKQYRFVVDAPLLQA